MFFNPNTESFSDEQLEGYLPYVEENPSDTTHYTVLTSPYITIYPDRVAYTHFIKKHIDTLKSEFISNINTKLESDSNNGFTVLGHTFDSDSTALLRLTAVYSVAATIPEFTVNWITKDNQTITLTNEDIKTVCLTAMQFQSNLIIGARLAKDAVLACNSVAELLAL